MPGRHRVRSPSPSRHVPAVFDPWERETAAGLTAAYPGWFVVWGTYWRCWSAFARFSAEPLVLHERDMDVLEARMREVELVVRTRRGR